MKQEKTILIGAATVAVTAAALIYMKLKGAAGTERPPKGAPQLDIENPGSQHDFPKPPMESELG